MTEDGGTLEAICQQLAGIKAALGQPPQRFLSVKSAAGYCDLSEDSVRRLVERGDLAACRPTRGKILIDRQELDRLILGAARPVRGSRGSGPRTDDGTRFAAAV